MDGATWWCGGAGTPRFERRLFVTSTFLGKGTCRFVTPPTKSLHAISRLHSPVVSKLWSDSQGKAKLKKKNISLCSSSSYRKVWKKKNQNDFEETVCCKVEINVLTHPFQSIYLPQLCVDYFLGFVQSLCCSLYFAFSQCHLQANSRETS